MSHAPPIHLYSAPAPARGFALPQQLPVQKAAESIAASQIDAYIDVLPTLEAQVKVGKEALPRDIGALERGMQRIVKDEIIARFDTDGLPGLSRTEQQRYHRFLDSPQGHTPSLAQIVYGIHAERYIFGESYTVDDVVQAMGRQFRAAIDRYEQGERSTLPAKPARNGVPSR